MSSVLQSSNKESMVTRNKSAQKKRLYNQTVNTLNQLMMRPNITIKKTLLLQSYDERTKESVPIQLEIRDVPKRLKKVDQSRSLLIPDSKEFHPEKHKRNVQLKKILLKPKHDYKVVGVTNKRKRRIPHKELKSPPPELIDPGPDPEVTFEDLVMIAEDQGMDDDDFMEILTCPSPVWWEDWSGDEEETPRSEDSTHNNTVKEYRTTTNSIENSEQSDGNENHLKTVTDNGNLNHCSNKLEKSLKNDINFFKNFVDKRSKLENILGGIKSIKSIPDKSLLNNENSKVRNNSIGGNSDASVTDEELLHTLENIEIPVQESDVDNKPDNLNDAAEHMETGCSKSTDPSEKPLNTKVQNNSNNNHIEESLDKDESGTELNEDANKIVPEDLPPLTKNPFPNAPAKSAFASPKHIESIASETPNSSANEDYSISDVNIKFLDEYDEKNKKENNLKYHTKVIKTGETTANTDVDLEDQIKFSKVEKPKVKVNKDRPFRKKRRPYITNNCIGPQSLARSIISINKYNNAHRIKVKDRRVITKDKLK